MKSLQLPRQKSWRPDRSSDKRSILSFGWYTGLLNLADLRILSKAKCWNYAQQPAVIGFGTLIVLARCKLLATSLLLATGWKGGYIFPIMFVGVALGMAGKLLFPVVPTFITTRGYN